MTTTGNLESMRRMVLLAAALAAAALLGCDRHAPATGDAKSPDSGSAPRAAQAGDAGDLPADLFVATPPEGARGVAELRSDTAATGEVVVHGRIGGRAEPFVDGAAVFLLADAEMKACNELHGDGCQTPWDYCCEPRDVLAAKTATVQIAGADGKPLTVGVRGRHGLEPLAEVTIAGDIAQRDTGLLVINARQIYVNNVAER